MGLLYYDRSGKPGKNILKAVKDSAGISRNILRIHWQRKGVSGDPVYAGYQYLYRPHQRSAGILKN